MFWFIIGGLKPKLKVMGAVPIPCPSCGNPITVIERLDQRLHLFFIPVATVKRGKEEFRGYVIRDLHTECDTNQQDVRTVVG